MSPGDDDGVFDGLGGNVDTEEGPIAIIRHLDVEGETLGILKQQRHANICVDLLAENTCEDPCTEEATDNN